MTPLLTGLVDDAGLFPPTSLSMGVALERHRRSDHPMLSGRFLVPTGRVDELLSLMGEDEKLGIHLIGGPVEVEDPRLTVLAVESREPVHSQIPCYVEGVSPKDLAGRDFFGKIRCGGESVPTVTELATYIALAARFSVPFKATAGLHEAVRHDEHHGFLNIVIATSRALNGGDVADAIACPDGQALADEAVHLSSDQVLATRWLLHSYGSCDTQQPIDEARALGLT
jgi:hypothetical protein